jgi:hypothetical protein
MPIPANVCRRHLSNTWMNTVHAIILSFLLAGFFISPAMAQDKLVRAQVNAATSNAIKDLRGDILTTRISYNLTVEQFIEKTDSAESLDQTIQRAQQIGGPRWIDDQTCQVKLEISGARVAYTLISIASAHPKLSPIPAAALEQQLSDWKDRTFSATGTSISAAKLQILRPSDAGPAWASVSDEARHRAIDAARADAVQHVLDDIHTIQLSPSQTVGDLLAQDKTRAALISWLEAQPVTEVRFKDNLQIEVTLSPSPDDLMDAVINSAQTNTTTLPANAQTVQDLRREFAKHVSIVVGRASVIDAKAQPAPQNKIELPASPPQWLGQLIETEALAQPTVSPMQASKLRTKTAAESRATQTLHEQINSLQLSGEMTLGDAAKNDPRIAEAIDRAMLRARVYKVEYRADGSVMVRMMIDPRDLWFELCQ